MATSTPRAKRQAGASEAKGGGASLAKGGAALEVEGGGAAGKKRVFEKANGRGRQLTDRLAIYLKDNGLSMTQFARDYLGMSPSHFTMLMNGERYIGSADRKTLELFAEALEASMAQIYLWAEILTEQDFVVPNEREQVITHIGQAILAHPQCAGFVGNMETWNSWPRRAQIVIGLLLQAVNRKTLIKMPLIKLTDEPKLPGDGPGRSGVH